MTWCMRCGSYHLFGACLTAKERAEQPASDGPCAVCGAAEPEHARQFAAKGGWHRYVPPSRVLARLRSAGTSEAFDGR